MSCPIYVIANPSSGRNSRDTEALSDALDEFGKNAILIEVDPEQGFEYAVRRAIAAGAETIVAAGGDGTVMAVAGALVGQSARMGVLPLGTFNFFARGLGLPEEPREAAKALMSGKAHKISVGKVNGQVFLNNASLGIYPHILRKREAIYSRWGRMRFLAHWSVLKTFVSFQRPSILEIRSEGRMIRRKTPLMFVARSAYQLDIFGLEGADVISDDGFAVFLAKGDRRRDLFRLAWRLVRRKMRENEDYELFRLPAFEVASGRRKVLVAFDGEKARMPVPLSFEMIPDAISVIGPACVE